jgi:site-specific DNA-methyltransferase (adenine-specific)
MELDIIYNEDCLEGMKRIPDQSIDLILCDLPYGTTMCDFDKSIIPFEPLWEQYKRIIKPNRAIVLFAQQPFTTYLISSNIDMWKYNWVWEKDNGTNFLNSHYQPLKVTEDICVFGTGATSNSPKGNMIYNPQFESGTPYTCKSGQQKSNTVVAGHDNRNVGGFVTENDGKRYPKNLIRFNRDKDKLHPTQKPVELIAYLIRTYSNEGDTVLDNCMGSGTTAVACIKEHRHYIGFELEKKYYDVAVERVRREEQQLMLF